MDHKFSVLMSLYIKEKVEYFQECMESILNQTILPNEIVIVEDGPISKDVYEAIQFYEKKYPDLIKRVPLKKNRGLGLALAEGVKACNYDLIARMDTDDICAPTRFELQLEEFKKNSHLDIVGGYIKEFEGVKENVLAERKVPLSYKEICKYQRKRSAFNHMTVMYKKKAVLNAGNYKDALYMEDDLLWCDMLRKEAYGINIPVDLVYVRTGLAMIRRRGGWEYFKHYCNGRKKIRKTGFISDWDYLSTILIQFIVCLMPEQLRFAFFKRILR